MNKVNRRAVAAAIIVGLIAATGGWVSPAHADLGEKYACVVYDIKHTGRDAEYAPGWYRAAYRLADAAGKATAMYPYANGIGKVASVVKAPMYATAITDCWRR